MVMSFPQEKIRGLHSGCPTEQIRQCNNRENCFPMKAAQELDDANFNHRHESTTREMISFSANRTQFKTVYNLYTDEPTSDT
jgi:hypothetical protein